MIPRLSQHPEPQENLPENLRDHSLFIAFAPVDNPQIAIAIIVENSSIASIIARSLLDYYFIGSQTTAPIKSPDNVIH